jgi:putative N6-adenine-specific DNA methylase
VRIALHLAQDEASVGLDLSGEPLHKRGYRVELGPAPLKETLAAAILLLGGADPEQPLVDPMAGSGTFPIEHALRARRIAPGLGRAFGFQRWPVYRGGPQSAFDRLRAEARAAVLPATPAPVVARDLHPKALAALRRNVLEAGLEKDILVEAGDARDLAPRAAAGMLVLNPPYGERLMSGGPAAGKGPARGRTRPGPESTEVKKLRGFYRGLAEMLERHAGWSALVLSGNPLLAGEVKRRPEIDHRLWNGPLEVHLLKYRL